MTLAERTEAKRAIDLVLREAAACPTAEATHELCINLLHGAAAAFVASCDVPTVVKYLRTLADVIEEHDEEERHAAMN
jgi:hypothetical protein